ncbi:hypothetical protein LSUCC1028_05775 [Rhodobacterales bacterium LSUCC1028]|nr:hypothetical protein [Rhodobacterales bacterium LSUCC1028]
MSLVKAWQDLVGGELTPAEAALIEACLAGRVCIIGEDRSDKPSEDREIRAPILKALITGDLPDQPTTDIGVRLSGAYISSTLDLSLCRARGLTGLFDCRFEDDLLALQAQFEFLNLSGSYLPKLNAQGARVSGGVFLKDGFHATGEVRISGAEIGGQLVCAGGEFENPKGKALNAQGAQVRDGIFFRNVTVKSGLIYLTAAHAGSLVDDLKSWPEGRRVILDGFSYDRIGGAPTDSAARLQWLARGDRWTDDAGKEHFFPQPYTQLAKTLRNMGHERGARDVLVARDHKIAAEEWTRAYQSLDGTWAKAWASLGADFRGFINFFSHLFIDYGHRPLKALWSLLALWLIATMLAHFAWEAGDMVPNSDVILTSENWAAAHDADHPAIAWGETPEGASWETFNRYAWAADVVIPILDFSQTQAWTPTTARGWAGYRLWWGKWALSAAGWIVLAFAAAGVTGVARRQD